MLFMLIDGNIFIGLCKLARLNYFDASDKVFDNMKTTCHATCQRSFKEKFLLKFKSNFVMTFEIPSYPF